MADTSPHEAFAAMQHIEAGDWDRFLMRLGAAIRLRTQTEAYAAHIVAGKEDGDG